MIQLFSLQVQSTIKQLVRDWSRDGAAEREGCYRPILDELNRRIVDADWDVLGQKWLIGAPWVAYYDPMKARIAELKAGNLSDDLKSAIAEAETEIACWEAAPNEIAYVLFVVRPK